MEANPDACHPEFQRRPEPVAGVPTFVSFNPCVRPKALLMAVMPHVRCFPIGNMDPLLKWNPPDVMRRSSDRQGRHAEAVSSAAVYAPSTVLPERFIFPFMAATATPEVRPDIGREEKTDSDTRLESGYLVICWNDPVNLMDYVTHVFQTVFGWQRQKAEIHMLQVHNQGKSVLTRESLEKAEFYVHQLQKYTLHATMERD
jgi:ATP-dependent Clp protease adaptor protein ClpS